MSVYLHPALFEHIQAEAEKRDMGMPGFIREIILDACPEPIQLAAGRKVIPLSNPRTISKPQPDPPSSRPPSDAELILKYRERVREFDSHAYTRQYIATTPRIPYRVVSAILDHPAMPKKGDPK